MKLLNVSLAVAIMVAPINTVVICYRSFDDDLNFAQSSSLSLMTEVEDGIIVSAGKKVSLAPGGMHLMFMGLTQQLKTGDEHIITLTFDKCGDWDVSLPVRNGTMSGHNQNSHKHH